MIYPWFEVWWDCAEGGGLYFHFKVQERVSEPDTSDVSDTLPGLC